MDNNKKGVIKDQASIIDIKEEVLNKEVEDSLFNQIISLGIKSYTELIEDEITEICGERYKHIRDREFSRWSVTETSTIFGGRKVKLLHPRVRNIRDKREKDLKTVKKYKDSEILSRRQMEQMIIGVSTRKYKRSLETGSLGLRTNCKSKSSVSRNFIAMTEAKLVAWRNEPIRQEYLILMIDGIVFKKTTVIVVLGIDKEGKKSALEAWESSTENSRVCTDLLHNLIERGFDLSGLKLAVIDGGKATRKALNDVFGKGFLIQRCQIHKKKNVTDYVPEHMRLTIRNAMSEAYNADSYETAKRLLLNIKSKLGKDYPQAARSLEEGLEETLTLHKLEAHKEIRKSLCTTNPIENLNAGIRNITRRVKRWRNSDMVIRWAWTGIIESEKNCTIQHLI
ncbi:MAG: IS256 family transposase [Spirochaetota bacterium]|nr:IS256 family transposase [Spirochaetota bacterium]